MSGSSPVECRDPTRLRPCLEEAKLWFHFRSLDPGRCAWMLSQEGLTRLGQPHGVAPAACVLDSVDDHIKANASEIEPILRGGQARVIELLTMPAAKGFPMSGPAGEEECGPRLGVIAENREHGPLVLRREVKEAVPG